MRFPAGIVATQNAQKWTLAFGKVLVWVTQAIFSKRKLNMRAKQSQLLNGKPVGPVWQSRSLASVGSIGPSNMGGRMVFSSAPGDRCSGRIDRSLTPASSHLLGTRVQLPAQAGGGVLDVTSDAWKHLLSDIKHWYRWYEGDNQALEITWDLVYAVRL